MSFIYISLVILIAINLSVQTIGQKHRQRGNFKHIRLDTKTTEQFTSNDNILIECPISQLTSGNHSLIKRLQRGNKRAAVITSWFKDGIKLNQYDFEDYGRIRLFQRILKIKHLLPYDSGVYHCEIISGSGINVKSETATININGQSNEIGSELQTNSPVDLDNYVKGEAPMFRNPVTQMQFSQLEHTDASFDCSATGIPSPQVQWLKDGKVISEEDFGMIRNIMQFDLKDLQATDSGIYTCQVSNQFGKIYREFNLHVLESLRFVENDRVNQTVPLGMTAVLKCGVESDYNQFGQTVISWYIHVSDSSVLSANVMSQVSQSSPALQIGGESYFKLDFKVNPVHDFRQNIGHYRRLLDNSLFINKVDLSNAGSYLCFANNTRGYNYMKYYLNVIQHPRAYSVDPLVDLFKQASVSSSDSISHSSNDVILSMPVIAIIVTASLAIVVFVGLLLCYKNI